MFAHPIILFSNSSCPLKLPYYMIWALTILGLGIGVGAGYYMRHTLAKRLSNAAETKAEKILAEAKMKEQGS